MTGLSQSGHSGASEDARAQRLTRMSEQCAVFEMARVSSDDAITAMQN